MPKLLATTKIQPLDLFLSKSEVLKSRGFDIVIPTFSNYSELAKLAAEAIVDEDISVSAPVIVLSSALGKGKNLEDEAIYHLRALGYRVVMLPGEITEESTKTLVKSAAGMGVYDFVYDPYTGEDVTQRILSPATVADVCQLLDDVSVGEDPENEAKPSDTSPALLRRFAEKVADRIGHKIAGHNPTCGKKPSVLLGMGSEELNNWFSNTFSDGVRIVGTVSGLGDFKAKVLEEHPCIVVLSRLGSMGGIPEADIMAEWAADYVLNVLYIAGELDEEGKEISDRLKASGIEHIISCPVGGFVSTDELVFVIYNIIRKTRKGEEDNGQQEEETASERTADTLRLLKNSAGKLSQIIRQTADKAVQEKKKQVKNRNEGIALEEKTAVEIFNENIKSPTTIVPGGVLVIVSPWRPGLAGRLAAQAAKLFSEVEGGEVAYIGASKQSTGALWLDIPEDELMMSDWRVPGSQCPIKKENLTIYAIDPAKDLNPESENETWAILKEARKTATYTVMDLGGDMNTAMKAAHQGRVVILVIVPCADPVELRVSQLWLRNLKEGKKNIVEGIDLRGCPPVMPEGIKPKVVVRNNPADALSLALRGSTKDEFIWS